ncbi:MAG: AbrB/MazE/SpoVT family DNA-binding domain-containing protein [Gammaproteobacteria bacterium]|jgi:bifunctional DNA-binding transcriptional regulator/antitoxin component of YhaV-PrlF toxin-antitoxin module|nr:AbrB/MazE/SpoVT family DNA-binding domain-containing protein [Gammaproteobacteria bacterium]MBT3717304.1 AbrB/MazE/SpoVT family DNA-binding domain-containing protein [Gammaproteobacteria bacterium]MBT3844595.1 AbrB/MazE/SpoVT family DNA-binding domain-containing protein [Gammaproteobacteria bacterium]MBT3891903.1 AbrB/MazE/SpoVT family DNA-binding domain-containing protein [Gammaproteobacteria bacterium]MBT4301189.1 AbrB/MazE/SpoVT family DNA-binding domain-containing protein [Gammaproteobac
MPKVSAKRQITLPIAQCRLANIEPGDEYESYVDSDGHITVVKKVAGAAAGLLKNLTVNSTFSDEESMISSLD